MARSYVPPVQIGEVMRGQVIGVVRESKSSLPVGTHVLAFAGWSEFTVARAKDVEKVVIPKGGKLFDAMSVLGITGLTAYFGMLDVGNVKAGDFVVVSGAAGATGSVAGQIAKLKGATVLGIAGSEEKVQWLKDLGFDDALNYKDPEFPKKFRAATKNYLMIISMRIRMQGFIVFDYEKQYPQARRDLAQWLAEGKIQRRETIVKGGLEKAETALAGLYQGLNTGKLLVEVKPEDSKVSAHL
ncbi:hypothetical protein DH86_00003891 [Scytalidium sp. 3C]|nr:hypothetical protein DH86_00003891 [Scytalidium sp. 3C]